jgi:hypothetical protein
MTSIPNFIDRNELRRYLESLDRTSDEEHSNRSNVLTLTLVPDGRVQVATVVFHQEPRVFAGCTPCTTVDIEFKAGGAVYQLIVDCDFLRMTAVYSSGEDALVEYATYLLLIFPNFSDLLQYRCCYRSSQTYFWIMEGSREIHDVAARPLTGRYSSEQNLHIWLRFCR